MARAGDVATGPGWELRCGDYRDVLSDVEAVDAVITDPPYSARTHTGNDSACRRDLSGERARNLDRPDPSTKLGRPIGYEGWGRKDAELCAEWAHQIAAGWVCVMSDHVLQREWESALEAAGRYVFAPLPIYSRGSRVRLAGDGPASWTVWMTVARRRRPVRCGSLPGGYTYTAGQQRESPIVGGKPLGVMRAIVRDYSLPGDLICDPCAGGGTTLLAACMEGRRAIGAELDPETFEAAVARLRRGIQADLFAGGVT